jgi:hypothetical protein
MKAARIGVVCLGLLVILGLTMGNARAQGLDHRSSQSASFTVSNAVFDTATATVSGAATVPVYSNLLYDETASGYYAPSPVRAVWVPGHYNRHGGWVPGHWRKSVWVPGHHDRYGRWIPGHWR